MSMEPSERTIVYGLVAACICGIIIVGFFLFYAGGQIFSSQGFSELYFEGHQKLPTVIEENEPLNFSFTVVSHNKEKMAYSYKVSAGDQKIRSGSLILPQENKYNSTVSTGDIQLKSTLIPLETPQISETQFTYNGGLGLLLPGDGTKPQVVTDPSKLYYPVQLPVSGQSVTLIFNPKAHESFQTTTTSTSKVGDITTISSNANAVEIKGQRITDVGYDITKSEWSVKNDVGIISASAKSTTQKYRYTFKKISVDVEASPVSNPDKITPYEVHFWIIVKDPSQQ